MKAFRARQLAVVFGRPHPVLTPDALREIASCLGPVFHTKKWVHSDASYGWVERFLNSTHQQRVQERLAFDLSADELAVLEVAFRNC